MTVAFKTRLLLSPTKTACGVRSKKQIRFYPLGKTKETSGAEPFPLMIHNYPLKYYDEPETYIKTSLYRVVNTHRLLVQGDNHSFVPRTIKT